MARSARLISKRRRRNSAIQLLDESEHGVEKRKVESDKRRRSLSEGSEPSGGKLALENPQQGHKGKLVGWVELSEVTLYREGTFSLCFTAILNDAEVVVKLLKSDAQLIDERAEDLFDTEIAVVLGGGNGMDGRSRHLVNMVGVGREERGGFVVLEKLTMTLEERLGNCRSSGGLGLSFPWWGGAKKKEDPWKDDLQLRMKTCLELARGLEHCHTGGLKMGGCVIHRDFNPKNLGFRDDGEAVVFDFGLSRVLENYTAVSNTMPRAMTGEVGSCRYQAPEVSCHSPYGAQSDVWSWAVVAWEIGTLQLPYGEITTVEYLCRVVEGGERLPLDGGWGFDEEFKGLLRECWEENMNKRPSMVEVVKRMESIMKIEGLKG
ncbi:hypothetical protein TrVE_jg2292 [Triparma verrucosa]|uniref:Protein kinase domain-containing protein n=2 Tax=Triparma verrucosa TaxID=1606542 RepID=A0A9W7FJX1_9STRA|nr:hypothetical protein TrVE_jg2292 [Triparma verrucosa]